MHFFLGALRVKLTEFVLVLQIIKVDLLIHADAESLLATLNIICQLSFHCQGKAPPVSPVVNIFSYTGHYQLWSGEQKYRNYNPSLKLRKA